MKSMRDETREPKVKIFIGVSEEGVAAAEALQATLIGKGHDATLWTDNIFRLGSITLESLEDFLDEFEFAVLFLTADDKIKSRGKEYWAARDNVLIELGLFMGRLGRRRTFVVYDTSKRPKIASDIAGLNVAGFDGASANLSSATHPAATQIDREVKDFLSHGRRTPRDVIYAIWEDVHRLVDRSTTRYVGPWPDFFGHLVEQIKETKAELLIACDVPTFGFFSSNDVFVIYRQALEKLSLGKKRISLLCYTDEKVRHTIRDQFSDYRSNWRKHRDNPTFCENLSTLQLRYGGLPIKDYKSFETALFRAEIQELRAILRYATSVSRVKFGLPLHVWVVDDSYAFFSITTYGISKETAEHGFETRDPSLVHSLSLIWQRYRTQGKER